MTVKLLDTSKVIVQSQGNAIDCTAFSITSLIALDEILNNHATTYDLYDTSVLFQQETQEYGNYYQIKTCAWTAIKNGVVNSRTKQINRDYVKSVSLPYYWNQGGYKDAIMQAIDAGKPVSIAFRVGLSYYSKENNGVWTGANEVVWVGSHAVVGVGYDSDRGLVKILDSKGPSFGNNGYMWIPMETAAGKPTIITDVEIMYRAGEKEVSFTQQPVETPSAPVVHEAPAPSTTKVLNRTGGTLHPSDKTSSMSRIVALIVDGGFSFTIQRVNVNSDFEFCITGAASQPVHFLVSKQELEMLALNLTRISKE